MESFYVLAMEPEIINRLRSSGAVCRRRFFGDLVCKILMSLCLDRKPTRLWPQNIAFKDLRGKILQDKELLGLQRARMVRNLFSDRVRKILNTLDLVLADTGLCSQNIAFTGVTRKILETDELQDPWRREVRHAIVRIR